MPSRRRRAVGLVLLALLVLAASVALACNTFLSNENGVFVEGEAGTTPTIDGGGIQDAFSPIPGCAKSPAEDPSVLQDKCGIFVFKTVGLDTNIGGMATPVATIKRAVELAAAHMKFRVYVCNAEYAEPFDINKDLQGVSLLGGLTCADFKWAYAPGTRAVIAGEKLSVGYAVAIRDAVRPMLVEDVEIRGAPAGAALVSSDPDGGAQPLIQFTRCAITARDGTPGATLNQGPQIYATGYFDGLPGSGATGGGEKSCLCPIGSNSGGQGGDGGPSPGPGAPGKPAGAGGGVAGCSVGLPGADNGSPAPDGLGATRIGQLSRDGWSPGMGTYGTTSSAGQPGGGGGGIAGPSGGGGGGGCGGCGGAGGGPGAGGSGSIALTVAYSHVSVVGSRLVAARGGAGGSGAAGNPGSNGGMGGTGACAGGRGGNGAAGGAGGGGAGGVSVGVLYVGRRPDVDPATTITVGDAGAKGQGQTAALIGIDGVSAPILEVKP